MKLNGTCVSLIHAIALVCSSPAFAANYITTFDTFIPRKTLEPQNGWVTNNLSFGVDGIDGTNDDLGQSDSVGYTDGYSGGNSDYWGLLGGLSQAAPIVDTSYLFRPLTPEGALFVDFSVRFGIVAGFGAFPASNRDTFGWAFRDASQQLLRISFVPDSSNTTKLIVYVYNAQNVALSNGVFKIGYDAIYDLHVYITSDNRITMTIGDSRAGVNAFTYVLKDQLLNNTSPAGVVAGLIHDISATWTLVDTAATPVPAGSQNPVASVRNNYGSNSLVFNNYAVFFSADPFPTTYSNWVSQKLASATETDKLLTGDPDGDGMMNLQEYAALQDPRVGGGSSFRLSSVGGLWQVEFLWNSHAGDVSYQLFGGPDLSTSANWPILANFLISQVLEGDTWRIKLRPQTPAGDFNFPSRYFFRLKINPTAP